MRRIASLLCLLLPLLLSVSLQAKEYPHYCCTKAGVLGPYPNDSIPEGGACYGTDSRGRRHEGKACYGASAEDDESEEGSEYPHYCCTKAGVLGPYPNDSIREGGACYGTDARGKQHQGKACFGDDEESGDDSAEEDDYPHYCCTAAGALGPYPNDSLPEGGACYGTDSRGKRHEGKACYGNDDADDDDRR